jgi:hypothetical protein
MILLCGIPTETPLALVAGALSTLDVPYVIFNQRHFANTSMAFEIAGDRPFGWLELDGEGYPLDTLDAVYSRLMDFRALPELRNEPETSASWQHCSAVHDALTRWTEISPARVVNRVTPMGSNSSKPYQAQLIRSYGFEVPETLITNQPAQVLEFRARYGKIIYKSTSGVRSIVQVFDEKDLGRLATIRWCPTQFQQYVEGTDVRVHVVAAEVFATRVESSAVDYRYAKKQVGVPARLTAMELPDEIEAKCVRMTEGLGLVFAGIDLKLAPDGRYYCFEVNPCPGYSYFEANTGQPIAMAVARHLAGLG